MQCRTLPLWLFSHVQSGFIDNVDISVRVAFIIVAAPHFMREFLHFHMIRAFCQKCTLLCNSAFFIGDCVINHMFLSIRDINSGLYRFICAKLFANREFSRFWLIARRSPFFIHQMHFLYFNAFSDKVTFILALDSYLIFLKIIVIAIIIIFVEFYHFFLSYA